MPLKCREERESEERQKRAGHGPTEAWSVQSKPVLNTQRVNSDPRAFLQGHGQWLWVTPKTHSPALSASNIFPATSQPPEQQALGSSTHHLCPPAPISSHPPNHLKHSWWLRRLDSLPENPNMYLFLGMCEREKMSMHNVYTLLMQGDTHAENSTQLAGPGLCRFMPANALMSLPTVNPQRYAHRNSLLRAVPARWQSLGNHRMCLHDCAFVPM